MRPIGDPATLVVCSTRPLHLTVIRIAHRKLDSVVSLQAENVRLVAILDVQYAKD